MKVQIKWVTIFTLLEYELLVILTRINRNIIVIQEIIHA
jgi:hypothetical protein